MANVIEIESEFCPFSPSIAEAFPLTFIDILFPAEAYNKLIFVLQYCSAK